MNRVFVLLSILVFLPCVINCQAINPSLFLKIADARLQPRTLADVCPTTDPLTKRLLTEYGAIFVATGNVMLPYKCILESEDEVQAFQAIAKATYERVGGVIVTLQEPALRALLAARSAAAKDGVSISPRGGSTASTRDYATTVGLWRSRFEPALRHWTTRGRIKKAEADNARRMQMREQIATVFAWEDKKIWFSKDLLKSILYSVAAPGASQHNFMLAIDIEQYGSARVRKIMGDHGWFQTVKSDLPHFTYLGRTRAELLSLGLRSEMVGGQEFWIPNME